MVTDESPTGVAQDTSHASQNAAAFYRSLMTADHAGGESCLTIPSKSLDPEHLSATPVVALWGSMFLPEQLQQSIMTRPISQLASLLMTVKQKPSDSKDKPDWRCSLSS